MKFLARNSDPIQVDLEPLPTALGYGHLGRARLRRFPRGRRDDGFPVLQPECVRRPFRRQPGGHDGSVPDPDVDADVGFRLPVIDSDTHIQFVAQARGRVKARFSIDDEMLAEIRDATAGGDKYTAVFPVGVTDEEGAVVANVDKGDLHSLAAGAAPRVVWVAFESPNARRLPAIGVCLCMMGMIRRKGGNPVRVGRRFSEQVIWIGGLVAILLVSVPTGAAEFKTGKEVTVAEDEVIDDDLYMTGETMTIKGTVKGDVVASGKVVRIEGVVEGDVMAAGQAVVIDGEVRDDVRIAGMTLKLGEAARVGDDLFAAGFSFESCRRQSGRGQDESDRVPGTGCRRAPGGPRGCVGRSPESTGGSTATSRPRSRVKPDQRGGPSSCSLRCRSRP